MGLQSHQLNPKSATACDEKREMENGLFLSCWCTVAGEEFCRQAVEPAWRRLHRNARRCLSPSPQSITQFFFFPQILPFMVMAGQKPFSHSCSSFQQVDDFSSSLDIKLPGVNFPDESYWPYKINTNTTGNQQLLRIGEGRDAKTAFFSQDTSRGFLALRDGYEPLCDKPRVSMLLSSIIEHKAPTSARISFCLKIIKKTHSTENSPASFLRKICLIMRTLGA